MKEKLRITDHSYMHLEDQVQRPISRFIYRAKDEQRLRINILVDAVALHRTSLKRQKQLLDDMREFAENCETTSELS